MSIKLYDFQEIGVNFLVTKKRVMLCDDMGLGKTVQSVTATQLLLHEDSPKIHNVIVLCPAPIKHQWVEAFHKFTRLKAVQIDSGRGRKKIYEDQPQIIVMSYELFLKDRQLLKIDSKTLIICDEASKLKNHSTQIHKKIALYSNNCEYFWLLTGTPIENNLQNIYTLINLCRPFYMSWTEFQQQYCKISQESVWIKDRFGIAKPRRINKITGFKNLDKFLFRVAPLLIRRKASEVNMPELTVTHEFFQKTTEQKKFEKLFKEYIDKDDKLTSFNILTILRGIDDSPELLNYSESGLVNSVCKPFKPIITKTDPKIVRLQEILEETNEQKIMIFTEFKKMADLIKSNLQYKYDVTIVSSESSNKAQLLEDFEKKTSDKKMILISTDVLSYGSNLGYMNLQINFDLPWNPQKLAQRVARIRRIDSKHRHKHVINFVGPCIETYIHEILQNKTNLFDQIVNGQAIDNIDIRQQLLEKISK